MTVGCGSVLLPLLTRVLIRGQYHSDVYATRDQKEVEVIRKYYMAGQVIDYRCRITQKIRALERAHRVFANTSGVSPLCD